jgi:hypothetical protein
MRIFFLRLNTGDFNLFFCINRTLMSGMERATGFEPATFSLGS